MMIAVKKFYYLLFLLTVGVILCSCSVSNDKEPGGIRVTPEVLESVSAAFTSASETEQNLPAASAETAEQVTRESHNTETSQVEIGTSVESSASSSETFPNTSITVITSSDEDPELVYWTENGSVYHLKKDCSSLRRSTNILQGSIAEALAAKKERVCKTCS